MNLFRSIEKNKTIITELEDEKGYAISPVLALFLTCTVIILLFLQPVWGQ